MDEENSSLWAIIGPFLMFGALSCALFSAGAYIYILYFIPPPYAGVDLQPGVTYVSARRFETHGLETLSSESGAIALSPLATASPTPVNRPATILVHGYNAQENKVAAYFADVITYLLTEGRYGGTIIVFDWPTVGVPFDELPTAQRVQLEMLAKDRPFQPGYELSMYGIDQRRAGDIGARSFLALLQALEHSPYHTINVIGHSMGCYLLAEAMKRDPGAAPAIASMIWLAPDVDEAILDEPWFHDAVGKLGKGLSIYYATNDTVLTRLSRIANGTNRIGATGGGPVRKRTDKITFTDTTTNVPAGNPHTDHLKMGNPFLQEIAQRIAHSGTAP